MWKDLRAATRAGLLKHLSWRAGWALTPAGFEYLGVAPVVARERGPVSAAERKRRRVKRRKEARAATWRAFEAGDVGAGLEVFEG